MTEDEKLEQAEMYKNKGTGYFKVCMHVFLTAFASSNCKSSLHWHI